MGNLQRFYPRRWLNVQMCSSYMKRTLARSHVDRGCLEGRGKTYSEAWVAEAIEHAVKRNVRHWPIYQAT